ncbi:MAG: DNA-binding NarL/FixJ family response regulator [Flavobacteriaceae bacterium]|jgi:DNA-binding NarL/FixJ family response regulator
MKKQFSILIAEDDMIIQMFISGIIKSAGFQIAGEARKGHQVLALSKEKMPDLVLMDIGLSGEIDGIETAKLLRDSHSIPVLFITGNSDEATIKRAEEAEPIGFIFKPLNERLLIEKIHLFQETLPKSST